MNPSAVTLEMVRLVAERYDIPADAVEHAIERTRSPMQAAEALGARVVRGIEELVGP